MDQIERMLYRKTWRYMDESLISRSRSALESFATDDTLCHIVGQQMSEAIVRTWVHDQTIVLGIQDYRLPYVEEMMDYCRTRGYTPIVRNSGGLMVALDDGVLNITLVFPEDVGAIDINDGYEAMLLFIQLLFPEAEGRIEAYEIIGSYCPGSYDLSIDGKKFAGISQRRVRNGIAVQIYLSIEGSGSERAEFVRELYDIGLQGEETKFIYPDIKPEVMASLNELLDEQFTVADIVHRTERLIHLLADQVEHHPFTDEELTWYDYYLRRIFKRNDKLFAK